MNEPTDLESSTILRDFNETQLNHSWSPFVCDGPSHMPTFKIYLYINDTRFEGCGSSKKRAKINAIQQFNSSNFNSVVNYNNDVINQNNKRVYSDNFMEILPTKKQIDSSHISVSQTSAVSILHEIFSAQTLVYEHEQCHGLLETISVSVSGNKYTGYGTNKKEAKEIACRNALKALYEVQPIDNKFKDQIEMLRTDYADSKIIDNFAYITDVVYQKLEFDTKSKEYSVIASFIKVNLILLHPTNVQLTYLFFLIYRSLKIILIQQKLFVWQLVRNVYLVTI